MNILPRADNFCVSDDYVRGRTYCNHDRRTYIYKEFVALPGVKLLTLSRYSAISAVAVLVALTSSSPASALDFSFVFSEGSNSVEGIIRGLVEGQTVYPQFIEVTSSSIGATGRYEWNEISTGGFRVVNGQITTAAWEGRFTQPPPDAYAALSLTGTVPFAQGYQVSCINNFLSCISVLSGANPTDETRAVTYTPLTAEVPGPLPVMGSAIAFGFSRRLRKRIRNC